MQELKLTIAKNIQKLRQEKQMTQLELAEILNYSDKTVSKWERGESLPDIVVLKSIADYFGVTLNYLVEEEHQEEIVINREPGFAEYPPEEVQVNKKISRNHYILTGTSIFMVVLLATLIYAILTIIYPDTNYPWLCYAYAVPVALIVWLVFNSLWFDPRKNYMIVSFLVWSLLLALFMTFSMMGFSIFPILLVGIPAQLIIWMWSKLKSGGVIYEV